MASFALRKTHKDGQYPDGPAYQLIAVDLDGTLLDSSGQPAKGAREAVRLARECGVQIALVSGRGMQAVLPMLKYFNLEGPFIASGGAIIAQGLCGEIIDHRPISLRSAIKFATLGHAAQVSVFFEYPQVLLSEADGKKYEHETRGFGYHLTVVENLALAASSAPSKVTMIGDPHRLDHIVELLKEQKTPNNCVQTMPHYLDIYHKDVNKGSAVKRLARHLGIPVRRVLAVGDYYNDIDMFRVAGMSVAMGNAPLEVRQAAQRVAPANDDGGAVWAIMGAIDGSFA